MLSHSSSSQRFNFKKLSKQHTGMVPVLKLLSRSAHVASAMLLLVICIAPLLTPPGDLKHADAITIYFSDKGSGVSVHTGRLSMILAAVMVVTGLFNAHALRVGTSLGHSVRDRISWRMHVYFLKSMLFLCLTPLLEMGMDWYERGSSYASSAEERRRTAAVTRAYIVILLAGIGSYAKVFREDSIAKFASGELQSDAQRMLSRKQAEGEKKSK